MKKAISVFFAVSILFSSVNINVYAEDAVTGHQDTAYETAFKEYQIQYQEYQTAHGDYIFRRSQYLRFKTLQSEKDAFDATVKMMQERDDLIVAYLKAITEKMNETPGLEDSRKAALKLRIEAESGWFTDHKANIPSAGTLDDLVVDNLSAKNRFQNTEPLFYEVLSTISYGKVMDFDVRLKDVFDQLKTKIDKIKSETRADYMLPTDKIQTIDRWVFDADSRISRSEDKMNESSKLISTFIAQKSRGATLYSTVLQRLGEAQQFLRESGNFFIEIIRTIKSSD